MNINEAIKTDGLVRRKGWLIKVSLIRVGLVKELIWAFNTEGVVLTLTDEDKKATDWEVAK